jgi:hypothetical protein
MPKKLGTELDMAKRPRDPNQLAKLIVDIATGEAEDMVSESKRHPVRQKEAGKRGGEGAPSISVPAAAKSPKLPHAQDGKSLKIPATKLPHFLIEWVTLLGSAAD